MTECDPDHCTHNPPCNGVCPNDGNPVSVLIPLSMSPKMLGKFFWMDDSTTDVWVCLDCAVGGVFVAKLEESELDK